jgi:hypothetical protein
MLGRVENTVEKSLKIQSEDEKISDSITCLIFSEVETKIAEIREFSESSPAWLGLRGFGYE